MQNTYKSVGGKKMKREFLKDLGLTDDAINKVMEENGKDINSTRSTLQSEIDNLKKDKDALQTRNTELDSQIKASQEKYKDYDDLAKYKADNEANILSEKRINYLKSVGCKHPDLLVKEIDWDAQGVGYDDEKKTYTGLDESIKGFKAKYGDLFESKDTPHPGVTPQDHTQGPEGDFLARYKAENPNLKF